MMPLTMAGLGETSSIKKIVGQDKMRRHLEDLGFVIGGDVTVVSEMSGNLILNVKGTRVAIDKSMATRIMI